VIALLLDLLLLAATTLLILKAYNKYNLMFPGFSTVHEMVFQLNMFFVNSILQVSKSQFYFVCSYSTTRHH
jgi:hypothetical protein